MNQENFYFGSHCSRNFVRGLSVVLAFASLVGRPSAAHADGPVQTLHSESGAMRERGGSVRNNGIGIAQKGLKVRRGLKRFE